MGIYQDAGSYPLYRIKGTEEISPFVGELAIKLGEVSLNKKALQQIKRYGRLIGFHSVFNEIEWINPYQDIREHSKKVEFTPRKYSVNFWADLFIDYLKNWFRNNLKQSEEYWILHSSGGDSRILSGILSKLRDEDNFKPNIKFVSWYPEAVQSEKILKHLGWEDKYIWNVGDESADNLIPENYWNRNNYYNFDECGYLTNGEIQPFGAQQCNFWRPYFNSVKDKNVIMMLLGDVIMGGLLWLHRAKRYFVDYRIPPYSKSVKWNVIISGNARWNGLGILGYIKYFKSLYTPTMDFNFANIGVQIPFICRYNDNVRKRIQEKLSSGLSKFENKTGVWTSDTKDIVKTSYQDYKNSIFFKKYKLDIFHPKKRDQAIPFLSLASLHDYLVKRDVRIRKGEL